MSLSALSVFAFGYLTERYRIYSAPLYVSLWVANGLFQSVGWPIEVAIMGNWFGHNARGTVMGVWSSCSSVGNIIGVLIASQVLYLGYQVRTTVKTEHHKNYSILSPSYPQCCWLIVSSFIPNYHLHLGKSVGIIKYFASLQLFTDSGARKESTATDGPDTINRPPPLGFFKAWFLPGVISVSFCPIVYQIYCFQFSLAFACLKFVNDGFFFWLPFYLHKLAFNHSKWWKNPVLVGFTGRKLLQTECQRGTTWVGSLRLWWLGRSLIGWSRELCLFSTCS